MDSGDLSTEILVERILELENIVFHLVEVTKTMSGRREK